MANDLDELTGPVNEEGRDVNVIHKQIPVKVGVGSTIFEIMLWVLFIIPGIVFLVKKIKAQNYLRQLQQKLQHDASQIDNFLEQRVVILTNCARILDKAIDLDRDTYVEIAKYRGGGGSAIASSSGSGTMSDDQRNALGGAADRLAADVRVAYEAYPDLKAHQELEKALQQNDYLQREITAAREVYNDTVHTWNTAIFAWPTKMIVAAKAGYTSRVPFATTREIKDRAREVLF